MRRWLWEERHAGESNHEQDPRRGLQRKDYRQADPREVGAPGGSPQEGEPVEERRARDREESN